MTRSALFRAESRISLDGKSVRTWVELDGFALHSVTEPFDVPITRAAQARAFERGKVKEAMEDFAEGMRADRTLVDSLLVEVARLRALVEPESEWVALTAEVVAK